MNVLSLFDGMSCGQIALIELGLVIDNYYASEIDKFAIKQTQLNFPKTTQLGSVTEWQTWPIDWSSIDLICAGSPCQGFSFAGKQLAFDDPRSKLFFVFVEILNHCRKFNPDVKFLLENVDMKKDHLRIISKYVGIFPVKINSTLVSAQNRERWYWTNIKTKQVGLFDELYTDIPQPYDEGILLRDILQPENEVDQKYWLSDDAVKYLHRTKMNERFIQNENELKGGCITANYRKGIPYNVMQLNPSLESGGKQPYQQNRIYSDEGKSTALMAELSCGSNAVYLSEPRHKHGENRYYEDKAPTIQARYGTGGDNIPYVNNLRRLTPVECSRLQTIPAWYKWECSDSQIYRMIGNGWTVKVIQHIFSFI